ncbi:MAG: single-stranded DNA-binding protein [Thermoleophilia bacterium]
MNSVQLVGRLATEIDLKEVTGGSKVSTFILAVDRNAEEADLRILPTVGRSSRIPAGRKSAP